MFFQNKILFSYVLTVEGVTIGGGVIVVWHEIGAYGITLYAHYFGELLGI